MTAASLASFHTRALATQDDLWGRTVKVAGVDKTATFTAPRLNAELDDSTVRKDRYRTTLRIAKTEVPDITTAKQWIEDAVVIQLPEGGGWRSYSVVTDPTDVHLRGEWKMDLLSIP